MKIKQHRIYRKKKTKKNYLSLLIYVYIIIEMNLEKQQQFFKHVSLYIINQYLQY